ncbi:MAG TPA: LEA type 2 family protein [Gemmatimonadales bacterium]|nr:LEA type 2 family protein [Gemmatimonadales bacterium]
MRTFACVILTASLISAGCGAGTVNPVDLVRPGVRLQHLALRNVGLSGGTLDLVMAIHNPNRITLQGVGLEAGLDVENNHFGDVQLAGPFTLTRSDTTLVTVPLNFRWSGVAAAARSVLDYGAVNYGLSGSFSVEAPGGVRLQVPFSGQGNVPLLRP